jgi:hypothetical protein
MKFTVLTLAAMQALCPGKHFFAGSDMSAWTKDISYNKKQLAASPPLVQKFIILHECGHTHGFASEVGADTYAFNHMHPSKAVTNEVCRELTQYDDEHYKARCANLRSLHERNR